MDESVDLTDKLQVDSRFAANGIEIGGVRMRLLPDDYDRDITQLNVILRLVGSDWVEGTLELFIYGADGFLEETHRIFPNEGLDRSERQILESLYDVSGMARAELTFTPDEVYEY